MDEIIVSFMEKLNRQLGALRPETMALSKYDLCKNRYTIYCYTKSANLPKNKLGELGRLGVWVNIPISSLSKTSAERLAHRFTQAFIKYDDGK